MAGNCFFECECKDGVYTVTANIKGSYTAFLSYSPDGFRPGTEYYDFEDSFEFRNREEHRPYFFILDDRCRCYIISDRHVPVGENRYFTDLGSCMLRSGQVYIRPGKLYIADDLTADMETVEAVRELGIQTIIDLSDPKDEGYEQDIQYDGVRMLSKDPDMYDDGSIFEEICLEELRQGRRLLVHSGPGGEDPASFMDRIICILETGETASMTDVPQGISEIRDNYLICIPECEDDGDTK